MYTLFGPTSRPNYAFMYGHMILSEVHCIGIIGGGLKFAMRSSN